MHNPEKLRVSAAAQELAYAIYVMTETFPRAHRFELVSQMRRAAISVGSNIYEGCGRASTRSLLAFLDVAHGSAGELLFQLGLAARLGLASQDDERTLRRQLIELRRMLQALIQHHRRAHGAATLTALTLLALLAAAIISR